jgi:hypothetical protein
MDATPRTRSRLKLRCAEQEDDLDIKHDDQTGKQVTPNALHVENCMPSLQTKPYAPAALLQAGRCVLTGTGLAVSANSSDNTTWQNQIGSHLCIISQKLSL